MSGSASVSVEVDYTDSEGNAATVRERDEVDNSNTSSLSGSGGSSGASTQRTVPDGSGGSERRDRSNQIPEGGSFKEARVTIKMDCGGSPDIELSGSGNVSATGSVVDGGKCIQLVTVSRGQSPTGGTETNTKTQKKCCKNEREVSFVPEEESDEVERVLASAIGSLSLAKLSAFVTKRAKLQG